MDYTAVRIHFTPQTHRSHQMDLKCVGIRDKKNIKAVSRRIMFKKNIKKKIN
jgi:hypothetical protein